MKKILDEIREAWNCSLVAFLHIHTNQGSLRPYLAGQSGIEIMFASHARLQAAMFFKG